VNARAISIAEGRPQGSTKDCYQQRVREASPLGESNLNKNLLNIMTSATDTDIREIKDLIAANTKTIADLTTSVGGLREEMRLGFANVDTKFAKLEGKIDSIDGRLIAVEGNLKGLDARLWGFGGTLLGAVLAALLTIFGRFLFAGSPIS
jgi:hypothetical protein